MESQLLFDNLFKRAYPKLFFYARSIVGNEDDAEDVVEDVFLELWRRRDSVEWGDKIDAYLYRAVFTRSINSLRMANHSEEQLSLLAAINDRRMAYLESEAGNPQRDAEIGDLRTAIDEALNALPAKSRQVFEMSYIDGLSHQEIAQRQGISVRTVEAHIYTALRVLRKRLDKTRSAMKIFLIFV